jgi:hypothetical protein
MAKAMNSSVQTHGLTIGVSAIITQDLFVRGDRHLWDDIVKRADEASRGGAFSGRARAILLRPMITSADIVRQKDFVKHLRDGRVVVGVNISPGAWKASSRTEQIELLLESLIRGLKMVKDEYVALDDKQLLAAILREAAAFIKSH